MSDDELALRKSAAGHDNTLAGKYHVKWKLSLSSSYLYVRLVVIVGQGALLENLAFIDMLSDAGIV